MAKGYSDPLAVAKWIEANLDLEDLSRKLFDKFGPAVAPSRLAALTPFDLLALFTRARREDEDENGEIDRVTLLHRHNHVIRGEKRLPPAVPPWLMPKVPRVGARVRTSAPGPVRQSGER